PPIAHRPVVPSRLPQNCDQRRVSDCLPTEGRGKLPPPDGPRTGIKGVAPTVSDCTDGDQRPGPRLPPRPITIAPPDWPPIAPGLAHDQLPRLPPTGDQRPGPRLNRPPIARPIARPVDPPPIAPGQLPPPGCPRTGIKGVAPTAPTEAAQNWDQRRGPDCLRLRLQP
ncbi:MAG: hypothetical protein QOC81_889, partial [Thermoanaerobaculia bacterium]|nr:hypothetical protein [Thermoanaerobaculia bacterium]